MDYWYYYLGISGLITSLVYLISLKIKEKEKRKRITLLKEIDVSKIKAIGDYEEKSKIKNAKYLKNNNGDFHSNK